LEHKYCGFYSEINIPQYVNDFETVSLKSSLYYTSIVDLTLKGRNADVEEVSLQLSFENEDLGAVFLPQVTNITSGLNAASRYYYYTNCTQPDQNQLQSWYWSWKFEKVEKNEECANVEVNNLKFHKGFRNKFIFIIADHRLAHITKGFIQKPSLDYFRQKPIKVNLRVLKKQKKFFDKFGVSVVEPTVLKEISWTLNPEELMAKIENFSDKYSLYVYYGNFGCAMFSILFFMLVIMRRGCCICHMKNEIMHVELLDKLEKKEIYDKMDMVDIFMYNHNAQDKYYRQQKYEKLK